MKRTFLIAGLVLLTAASCNKSAVQQSTQTNNSAGSANPAIRTFTSANLGISFNYYFGRLDKTVGGVPLMGLEQAPTEVGDKVSLDEDQYVEVFTKNPSDTLQQAIEKKFLSGFSNKECFVVVETGESADSNNIFAGISFPENSKDEEPAWITNKCPKPYTNSNENKFFVMDSKHPDKFAFVKLAQEPSISDGQDHPWSYTLKFK